MWERDTRGAGDLEFFEGPGESSDSVGLVHRGGGAARRGGPSESGRSCGRLRLGPLSRSIDARCFFWARSSRRG